MMDRNRRFFAVLSAIIEMWAVGDSITQQSVARRIGFRETKHVWPHFKTLERIGVLYRITHHHQHVEFIFLGEIT